jgi:hypothetical protein
LLRRSSEGKVAEIRDEVGDVTIFLGNLCDRPGVDPALAAKAKLKLFSIQDHKSWDVNK